MMENLGLLKIGCSRFVFGEDAINALPDEVLRYGTRAIFVGGATTLPLVMNKVRDALCEKGIEIAQQLVNQPNSMKFAKSLAEQAEKEKTEVIIAIGGGKCMDLCKVFADLSGLPIITVPTSIATCAASSAVSILYTPENGSYDCTVSKEKEVDSVIADTAIIRQSPPRLTAAGILDSLAKLPEIVNGPDKLSYPEKSLQNYMAYANSLVTYDFLTRFGLEAYRDPSSRAMTDLVMVNLIITSMISGFSSGADQLAVAHGLYDGVRKYFPVESKNALHGEIVAVGLLMQLRFNRCEEAQYKMVRDMMMQMNMPLTLEALGVQSTKENREKLYQYNVEKNNMTKSNDLERLQKAFEELV